MDELTSSDAAAKPDARSTLADPAFVAEVRRQMLRFARLQLGDDALAEDTVQEALVGALTNARAFGGRAAVRTWMFAILKHKIADVLRVRQRRAESSLVTGEDGDDPVEALFDARGHWRPAERPAVWGDPEGAMRSEQFWRIFEACLDHLPAQQARVFMMREFVGLETADICLAAGVTVTNLNVLLHRARLHLRECLENRWFAAGQAPC
jgi:RNA polymerase sigma-70 factor (ECF subfamily)